jgi:HK97 gp10 family phage protein
MFRDMQDVAEMILDDACKAGGEIVLDAAKQNAPVKTGALKRSLDLAQIKTKRDTNAAYKVHSKGVRNGGVRYGPFVELGTTKAPAQPYLRTAYDNNEQNIKETISEKLSDGLDRVM